MPSAPPNAENSASEQAVPEHTITEHTEVEWSQVRETVTMLYLSAAQIESAMEEGSKSVHSLTDAFSTISAATAEISTALTTTDNAAAKDAVERIDAQIQGSVVAFQFHDRISQRLHNVTQALHKLSDLLASDERVLDPDQWRMLQNDIKSGYTMESERLMFEHIMRGATVQEALAVYSHHFEETTPDDNSEDEIELF